MACAVLGGSKDVVEHGLNCEQSSCEKNKSTGNRQKGIVQHLIHLTTAVGSHMHPVPGRQPQTFNTALEACTGEGGPPGPAVVQ